MKTPFPNIVITQYAKQRCRDRYSARNGPRKFKVSDCIISFEKKLLTQLTFSTQVLGIGTFWHRRCGKNCESGDASYTCERAKAEYKALGFKDELVIQSSVCGHWSEANFKGTKDE